LNSLASHVGLVLGYPERSNKARKRSLKASRSIVDCMGPKLNPVKPTISTEIIDYQLSLGIMPVEFTYGYKLNPGSKTLLRYSAARYITSRHSDLIETSAKNRHLIVR
jgi:hypothetical protein